MEVESTIAFLSVCSRCVAKSTDGAPLECYVVFFFLPVLASHPKHEAPSSLYTLHIQAATIVFGVLMMPPLLPLAANRNQIFLGDTLCSAGVEGDMSRVEALDWDQTVSVLGSFAGERWVPSLLQEKLIPPRLGLARVFPRTILGHASAPRRFACTYIHTNW